MNTTLNLNQNVNEFFNQNQKKLIAELCESFLEKSFGAAKHILWKLCYRPDYLKELSPDLFDSINKNEDLPLKSAIDSIKEELRAQYVLRNPCFTFGILHKNDKTISGTKCSDVDGFACDTIYEAVENYLEDKYTDKAKVERLIYLLDSDQVNIYFGGLRELKFSPEEASYIAENFVTSNIATLVENMYSTYSAKKKPQANQTTGKIDKKICSIPNIEGPAKKEIISIVPTIVEDDSDKISNITLQLPPSSITPSSVLSNSTLIKNFYENIDLVLKAGLSIEELISKKELVSQLLETASKF